MYGLHTTIRIYIQLIISLSYTICNKTLALPLFRWKDKHNKDGCSTQIFICISVSPSLFNKILLLQINKSVINFYLDKKHPELKELCCRGLMLWEGWYLQTPCTITGRSHAIIIILDEGCYSPHMDNYGRSDHSIHYPRS